VSQKEDKQRREKAKQEGKRVESCRTCSGREGKVKLSDDCRAIGSMVN
jgi:hypothetical protein